MNDVTAAPDAVLPDIAETVNQTQFYIVSKRKFTVLYLATLGLYGFYWFYKQWSCYKEASAYESAGAKIWPVARALFAIFFVHSLFREVKQRNQAGSELDGWEHRAHATFLVVLILASNGLDRVSAKSIGSPYTDILSLAILAPLLFFFYKAQVIINISCGDPEGAANSKFTGANYAWIVIGVICWLLVIAGLFLP